MKLFPVDRGHVKDEKSAALKAHQLAGGDPAQFVEIIQGLDYVAQGVAANDNGGFSGRINGRQFQTIWNPGGRRAPRGVKVSIW